MTRRHVAIVGYGTGGQAAALALARHGHSVEVFERVPDPGPVGAGFLLQPTGLQALWRLGLLDEACALGAPVARLHGETPEGRAVMDMHYADLDVRLSGVKVGTVSAVAIDPQTYLAKLTLSVSPTVKLPDDSSARVASDGLLGGAYVALEPGGSAEMLASGSEILNTTGTVDLLSLLAAAAGGAGAGAKQEEPTP